MRSKTMAGRGHRHRNEQGWSGETERKKDRGQKWGEVDGGERGGDRERHRERRTET